MCECGRSWSKEIAVRQIRALIECTEPTEVTPQALELLSQPLETVSLETLGDMLIKLDEAALQQAKKV